MVAILKQKMEGNGFQFSIGNSPFPDYPMLGASRLLYIDKLFHIVVFDFCFKLFKSILEAAVRSNSKEK